MQTDLNKKVDYFFKGHSVEAINIDTVSKSFTDLKESNSYGNILHAIVNYKYDEEKILKTIEILMSLGIDVNFQAKDTGYSFIHLALYGYTDKNHDYSYSTEFILKLIELAKKYHFNVNLKDRELDSVMHSALASEVYTGKMVPILKALGVEFDLKNKDDMNHNIYEALLYYKAQAKSCKNQTWLERLSKEEEEIHFLVQNITLEEVEMKLNDITIKFNSILNQLSIYSMDKTKDEINQMLNNYQLLLKQRSHFTESNYSQKPLFELYQEKIKELIQKSLITIKEKPSRKEIKFLKEVIQKYGSASELEVIEKMDTHYKQQIQNFLICLNQCDCSSKLDEIKENISQFTDEEVKSELQKKWTDKKNTFIAQIQKITLLENTMDMLQNWIIEASFISQYVPVEKEEVFLENDKMEELEAYYQSELEKFDKIKALVKSTIEHWVKQLGTLIDKNIFVKDDLLQMMISNIENTEENKKENTEESKKNNKPLQRTRKKQNL